MREGKDAGTEKKNSLTTSISETTAEKKKIKGKVNSQIFCKLSLRLI